MARTFVILTSTQVFPSRGQGAGGRGVVGRGTPGTQASDLAKIMAVTRTDTMQLILWKIFLVFYLTILMKH